MLAAGCKSVVATMWTIHDREAPMVTKVFYETLLKAPPKSDGRADTAYALHVAVQELKKHVGVSEFKKWLPFVHFGL